ncbi:MAG: response regulator [Acidobacteriota bacterium]
MTRVLIVDDEAELVRNIANYLGSFGDEFRVSTALTGEDALLILKRGSVDVLVTDVRLPAMDGLDLLRRTMDLSPNTRVLVMTAFASPDLRSLALREGAQRFIEKPLDLDDLRKAVHEAMDLGRGWTGQVGHLDMFDVAQIMALSRKDRTIQVSCQREKGVLRFAEGSLLHASVGDLEGVKAFYRMVDWVGGRFEEIEGDAAARYQCNVDLPLTHLLMEAARLRDEQHGSRRRPGAEEGLRGTGQEVRTLLQELESAPVAVAGDSHIPEKEERPMALKDHFNELAAVEGFRGLAVFSPNGEMLDGIVSGKFDIKAAGMFANNALLNAQKATDQMGVGRGNLMQIRAPQAVVIMRCLNEAPEFSQTVPGKAHFHTVVVLDPEGNTGLASMLLDKTVTKMTAELR